MKQTLLKSVLGAFLTLGTSVLASAQTTVYGCMPSTYNCVMASFDLDAVNNETAIVPETLWDMADIEEVASGETAGDKYYAFYTDNATYSTCFGSFNFATGEVVLIKKFSYEDAPTIVDMAYDAASGVLYGLSNVKSFDDEGIMTSATELVEINTEDGSLTTVASYPVSAMYDALTTNGNGEFYWVHNVIESFKAYPNVYRINSANEIDTLVTNNSQSEEPVVGVTSYNNSAAYKDGNITYIANTTVFNINLESATIHKSGTLKKSVSGITFTKSTASAEGGASDEEKPVTRLLVRVTRYGDSMGYAPKDKDMTKTEYFYNSDLKLSRVVESGREYDDYYNPQDYTVMSIVKYNYDKNNLLDNTEKYVQGLYDFGDKAFKFNASESYGYNEKGQLVKEPSNSYILYHEYDEDGNIVQTTTTNAKEDTIQVLNYYEFVAKNKPMVIVSSSPKHPEWTTYIYTSMCEYDENFNKIREVRASDPLMETIKQMETWEYDGTFLKQYNKYISFEADGTPKPYFKTCYSMVDGNPNKIMQSDSIYYETNKVWYGSGRPYMSEYVEFEGMDEMTATQISVSAVNDTINTAKLDISIPQIAMMYGSCDFNIYRNGSLIDTKNIYELFATDEEGGFGEPRLEYRDSLLYNGDYEYFVQPVVGGSDIMPFDLDDEQAPESVAYCISNIAEINMNLELPAVTDLKAESKTKGSHDEDIVTFTWTNTEYPEEYGFICNDLYFNANQLAEATTEDPEVTTLDGTFFATTANVFILTRFKYGKVASDTIEVDLNNVASGIEAVTKSGTKVGLTGKVLNMSENADVAVYSLGGKLETKAINTRRVSLEALRAGTYIVCVTRDGVTSACKVILK